MIMRVYVFITLCLYDKENVQRGTKEHKASY